MKHEYHLKVYEYHLITEMMWLFDIKEKERLLTIKYYFNKNI